MSDVKSQTNIAQELASYAARLSFDDLPPPVVHQAKWLTVDCMGCGLRAFDSEPGRAARDLASTVTGAQRATILGTTSTSTPDLAAFANGTMVRFLDFNDTYASKSVAHPSDNIPVVLAAAEAAGVDGKTAILGMVLGYEVQAAWCDTWGNAASGAEAWDQAVYGIVSQPLAVGKVMGLNEDQMAHALRMSVAWCITLAGARGRGTAIPHIKASTMANAGRNAIFAAQLAQRGYTGPANIFEGPSGYFEVVVRGQNTERRFDDPVSVAPLTGQPARPEGFRIMQSSIKRFPSGYPSQEFIEAALECRKALGIATGDEVERVRVRIYNQGLHALFTRRGKLHWRPENRETADHSGPFVVACALSNGWVDPSHFERGEFLKPKMHALMDRVAADADPECQKVWPQELRNIVTVETKDGRSHTSQVSYHRGHYRNPFSDQEMEDKFNNLTQGVLPPKRRRAALDAIWRLDEAEDLKSVMDLLAI